jgi:hypothetical protein
MIAARNRVELQGPLWKKPSQSRLKCSWEWGERAGDAGTTIMIPSSPWVGLSQALLLRPFVLRWDSSELLRVTPVRFARVTAEEGGGGDNDVSSSFWASFLFFPSCFCAFFGRRFSPPPPQCSRVYAAAKACRLLPTVTMLTTPVCQCGSIVSSHTHAPSNLDPGVSTLDRMQWSMPERRLTERRLVMGKGLLLQVIA